MNVKVIIKKFVDGMGKRIRMLVRRGARECLLCIMDVARECVLGVCLNRDKKFVEMIIGLIIISVLRSVERRELSIKEVVYEKFTFTFYI